jgi:hypothetical protein
MYRCGRCHDDRDELIETGVAKEKAAKESYDKQKAEEESKQKAEESSRKLEIQKKWEVMAGMPGVAEAVKSVDAFNGHFKRYIESREKLDRRFNFNDAEGNFIDHDNVYMGVVLPPSFAKEIHVDETKFKKAAERELTLDEYDLLSGKRPDKTMTIPGGSNVEGILARLWWTSNRVDSGNAECITLARPGKRFGKAKDLEKIIVPCSNDVSNVPVTCFSRENLAFEEGSVVEPDMKCATIAPAIATIMEKATGIIDKATAEIDARAGKKVKIASPRRGSW